jgi:hypothetical protein
MRYDRPDKPPWACSDTAHPYHVTCYHFRVQGDRLLGEDELIGADMV